MKLYNKDYKNIFVTSDTHFSHFNIIKYCNRPFNNIQEMNEILIKNWNECISNSDLVFHLGDFQMINDYNILYKHLSRLNGDKVLLLGNHDYMTIEQYLNAGFIDVQQRWEGIINNNRFVMSHYQMMTWNWSHKGSINLYGHEHDRQQKIPNHEIYNKLHISEKKFNVCVDANNYKPVNINIIISLMNKRDINNNF